MTKRIIWIGLVVISVISIIYMNPINEKYFSPVEFAISNSNKYKTMDNYPAAFIDEIIDVRIGNEYLKNTLEANSKDEILKVNDSFFLKTQDKDNKIIYEYDDTLKVKKELFDSKAIENITGMRIDDIIISYKDYAGVYFFTISSILNDNHKLLFYYSYVDNEIVEIFDYGKSYLDFYFTIDEGNIITNYFEQDLNTGNFIAKIMYIDITTNEISFSADNMLAIDEEDNDYWLVSNQSEVKLCDGTYEVPLNSSELHTLSAVHKENITAAIVNFKEEDIAKLYNKSMLWESMHKATGGNVGDNSDSLVMQGLAIHKGEWKCIAIPYHYAVYPFGNLHLEKNYLIWDTNPVYIQDKFNTSFFVYDIENEKIYRLFDIDNKEDEYIYIECSNLSKSAIEILVHIYKADNLKVEVFNIPLDIIKESN